MPINYSEYHPIKNETMKKLLFILITMYSLTTSAQWIPTDTYSVSFGFDPKLAISGAYEYDNTPTIDAFVQFSTRLASNIEIGVGAEYAKLKPSYLSGSFFVNKVWFTPNQKLAFVLGAEAILIKRGRFSSNRKINAQLTYAAVAEIRYYLTPNISVGARATAIHRKDLKLMYNDHSWLKPNGYLKLTFETKR